jgi:hypothetical protein
MKYHDALKEVERVGASKVEGLPLLAMTLRALALAHAINPELAYDGAVRQGLSAKEVRKLGPVQLGDLMFE